MDSKNTHNNFLGAIGEVFEKVPEESRLDFQMDVLQYVYAQYKNYKIEFTKFKNLNDIQFDFNFANLICNLI